MEKTALTFFSSLYCIWLWCHEYFFQFLTWPQDLRLAILVMMPVAFFLFFNIWTVQVLCIHVSTLPSLLEQICCFKLYAYIYLKIAFIIIVTNTVFQVVCIYIYIYQDSIHYHCNKYIVHVFIQRVFIQPTYLLICQMWLTLMCALFSNTLARNFVYSPADLWVRLIYYTQSGQFITSHTIRLILLHHTQSGWFFFIHHTQSG